MFALSSVGFNYFAFISHADNPYDDSHHRVVAHNVRCLKTKETINTTWQIHPLSKSVLCDLYVCTTLLFDSIAKNKIAKKSIPNQFNDIYEQWWMARRKIRMYVGASVYVRCIQISSHLSLLVVKFTSFTLTMQQSYFGISFILPFLCCFSSLADRFVFMPHIIQ